MRQLFPRSLTSSLTKSRPRSLATWQGQRFYSVKATEASTIKPQDLDASKLTITKTTTPKELVPSEELVFGRTFTGESFAPSGRVMI